ncbi:hypothetical protein LRS06_22210 [Hymenobacter sp. J193]|uniref:hypothetical protein n=1 Tax=Hymenobacter sp. J193 TaxID=2898429 RepID=UPI00215184D1|nr:hypothetical protein [Hymenobacter sp. J193]MCR5890285.1 hypothetical protein [Hymenobacter sp. J193]MCR5890445.1 hypothetical protein [Hymenobacter sp. J193]
MLAFITTSCESVEQEPAPPLTTSIALQVPQLANDSTAVLTWSALNNPDLKEYHIKRWEILNDPDADTFAVRPATLVEPTVSYLDATIPYSDDVLYQVVGVLASGQTIESNTVTFHRPNVHIARAHIRDVLFDETTRMLYFVGPTGTVSQYSLDGHQMIKTIEVGMGVNYGSLSTFQGRRELYLPFDDGIVLIYDASTLTQVDRLRVYTIPTPHGLSSVLASNGQLYISTTRYIGPTMRVYDRATKAQLPYEDSRDGHNQHLYLVPGSSSEVLGMGMSTYPMPHTYYSFTPTGNFLGSQRNSSHRLHTSDGRVFAFFPDGQHYITGAYGDIYHKTTTHQASLPNLSTIYTCYGPDAATQTLYAGTTDRRLYAFNLQAPYSLKRQIKTRFYPFKIFKDPAGGFILLSIDTPVNDFFASTYFYDAKVLIEHLD